MNIRGWAFTEHEESLRDERYKRFKQLNKKEDIKIDSISTIYSKKTYKGTILNKNLSELDILILCDNGNTCFGGYVNKNGNRFEAVVYTD